MLDEITPQPEELELSALIDPAKEAINTIDELNLSGEIKSDLSNAIPRVANNIAGIYTAFGIP